MMSPLVSVVITTFNRPDKVINAVRSVLDQTYERVEIIVVDDGSTVPVQGLVQDTFGQKVKCVSHPTNLGAPKARNTGIEHISGDYVAFLDDDDRWIPSKLAKQLHVFEEAPFCVGLVYGGYSYVSNSEIAKQYLPLHKGNVFEKLLKYNFVGSCSIPLIRRRCFQDVGVFDERFPSFQDWDMWLRILRFYEADYVHEVLVAREAHGDQITTDLARKLFGRELIVAKYIEDLKKYRPYLSHQYRALSDNSFLLGNWTRGVHYCLKSFQTDPFSFASVVNLLLIAMPDTLRRQVILDRKTQMIGTVRFYR